MPRVSPEPTRADDKEQIPDHTVLLRILKNDFVSIEADGTIRMRSNAFLDGQFETSCFLDQPGLRELIAHFFADLFIARVTAQHVRESGYMVAFATDITDCAIEELRPYHVVLFPPAGVTNNENKRICERIRNGAELVGRLRE